MAPTSSITPEPSTLFDGPQSAEGSIPIGGNTVSQLQSQEQASLLDAIDKLRRENIDTEIGIPQIVVCGDQSSGKSSLLEAIAQVPFQAGSGAVTMFATEVCLRRSSINAVSASILPSWSRNAEQRATIAAFNYRPEKLDRDEFRNLFALATEHLEDLDKAPGFRWDRLHIEVSGPTQPHLTLIDLPGLIRTTTGRQSPGAVSSIQELTKSYLQKPRTIVLAVVSATSDFQVQSVGDLMRSPDIAQRMMGVITKPDGALSQDDALKMIELARNEDLKLGLGWHVVRNLSHEEEDRSPKHRDSEESKFFASGAWSRLPGKDLGIDSLRSKLCQCLFESIKRELPALIQEMSDELAATQRNIEQLGRVRTTAKDCLWYLSEIKSKMHRLASAASDGVYDDPNIAGFFGKGEYTKLRNLITIRNDDFNREIRSSGKTYVLTSDNEHEPDGSVGNYERDHSLPAPVFQPPYYSAQPTDGPYAISVGSYCSTLSTSMTHNRGKNLPDLPNYRDIQGVFRSQSIRWDSLVRSHVESCFEDTFTFMSEAILHVAGEYTSTRLLEEYIRPAFETRRSMLVDKVEELLWPYTQCHPITAHPEYAGLPRMHLDPSNSGQFDENTFGTTWSRHAQIHRFSADHIHAAHVLDRAEAYYEIALDTLIDNVATLAIERVLLRDLPNLILSDCEPSNLSDEELESVAGESEAIKDQCTKSTQRAAALDAVIRTCRQYKGISQSTPQRTRPDRSASAAEATRTHANTWANESTTATEPPHGLQAETTFAFRSPATPRPVRSHRQSEQSSLSPNDSAGSSSRSSESSGNRSTPFSSPGSASPGQHYNNASGSVAYRSKSRSSIFGSSH